MARIKLTLDLTSPDHQRILLHGQSNAGKTFLAGSAMAYYVAQGRSTYFIDTKGEEGTRSIINFGLGGGYAETVETFADYQEAIKEVTAAKTDLLVVDSLKFVWKMIMMHVLKSDRSPVISKTSTDWQDLYRCYDRMLFDLVGAAKDLIVICPSDVSKDMVKDEMLTGPDLPGRKIPDTIAAFDMVGYMVNSSVATMSRRMLNFQGMNGVTTKFRASKKALTAGIKVEDGINAWAGIQNILAESV